jgi:hypothetical protein
MLRPRCPAKPVQIGWACCKLLQNAHLQRAVCQHKGCAAPARSLRPSPAPSRRGSSFNVCFTCESRLKPYIPYRLLHRNLKHKGLASGTEVSGRRPSPGPTAQKKGVGNYIIFCRGKNPPWRAKFAEIDCNDVIPTVLHQLCEKEMQVTPREHCESALAASEWLYKSAHTAANQIFWGKPPGRATAGRISVPLRPRNEGTPLQPPDRRGPIHPASKSARVQPFKPSQHLIMPLFRFHSAPLPRNKPRLDVSAL